MPGTLWYQVLYHDVTPHRELYVNQYVAFGLSGAPNIVRMQGGDVTVAWIDAASGVANAVDYYLESYTQVGQCLNTL